MLRAQIPDGGGQAFPLTAFRTALLGGVSNNPAALLNFAGMKTNDELVANGITFATTGHRMQYDQYGLLTYAPHNLSASLTPYFPTGGGPNFVTLANTTGYDGTTSARVITALPANNYRFFVDTAGQAAMLANVKYGVQFKFRQESGTPCSFYIQLKDASSDTVRATAGPFTSTSDWQVASVVGTVASATTGIRYELTKFDSSSAALTVGFAVCDTQIEVLTYQTAVRPFLKNLTGSPRFEPRFDYDPATKVANGVELVTNGDFSNGTTGWSAPIGPSAGGYASISAANNTLTVTNDGTGTHYGYASISFPTIPGVSYIIRGTNSATVNCSANINNFHVGSIEGGTQYLANVSASATDTARTFTAVTATTYVSLNVNGANAAFASSSYKNVSVQPMVAKPIGLRVERTSETNVALWSQDLTNAAWTKGTVSATSAGIGPDGLPMTKITTSSVDSFILQTVSGQANGTGVVWGISFWAYVDSGTLNLPVLIDGGDGSFALNPATTTAAVTTTLKQFFFTGTQSATAASNVRFGFGGFNTLGSGVNVYVGGVKLVKSAAYLTSHIPTTTAAVTRPAETASTTNAAILAAINGVAGCTCVVKHMSPRGDGGVLRTQPVAAGSYIGISSAGNSTGGYNAPIIATQANIGVFNKVSMAWDTVGGLSGSRNGGSISTVANDFTGLATSLDLGICNASNNPLDGVIEYIKLYTGKKPDSFVQALST